MSEHDKYPVLRPPGGWPDDDGDDDLVTPFIVLVVGAMILWIVMFLSGRCWAAWGPTPCPASVEAKVTWVKMNDGWWHRQVNGRSTGAWNPDNGDWWEVKGDALAPTGERWSWDSQAGCWKRLQSHVVLPAYNFGVDFGKSLLSPAYSIAGIPVSRLDALAAVSKPVIPDDSNKEHWTVVGPVDWNTKVVAELAEVAGDKAIVKGYSANSWVATEKLHLNESEAFRRSGKAVVVQDPEGYAVHVQYDWNVGDAQVISDGDFKRIPDLVKEHKFLVECQKEVLRQVADAQEGILKDVEEAKKVLAEVMKKLDEGLRAFDDVKAQVDQLRAILPDQADLKNDLAAVKSVVGAILWVADNRDTIIVVVVLAIGGVVYLVIRRKP